MKAINYWERFLSTGTVSDYLSYRDSSGNSDKSVYGDSERESCRSVNEDAGSDERQWGGREEAAQK